MAFDSYDEDYFPKKGLFFEVNYVSYLLAFYSFMILVHFPNFMDI